MSAPDKAAVHLGMEGWKEATIAWEVCASIHREYAKKKDPFFTTRQSDFVKHAEAARAKALTPAPDMAEVERLLDEVERNVRGHEQDARWAGRLYNARTALLDYVRGVMTERHALISDNERLSGLYEQAVKGRADMRILAENMDALIEASNPVSEVEDAAMHAALRTSVTLVAKGLPVSAAEVPMPEHVEQLAITRYRPVPNGMFGCKVVAGDGTRSVFEGTKSECTLIARKLTEAFLDGAHVAGDAREAAGYAAGVTSGAKQMFDYLQFAAANTSDTAWDTQLCELSQDALAAVSPAAHTEWKTIQRVASESRAAGEAAGYARGLAAGGKDAERLDWLSRQFVTVRIPMRYGSKVCITGMPTDDDGESKPWNIRAAIDDAALRGEVKP